MVRVEWPLHIVRRVVLGGVLAVLLGVGGYFLVSWITDSLARCGDGVVKMGADDECVGVTDGSYHFSEDLVAVERLIADENERVVKSGESYVSIAYLTSLTLHDDDSNSPESIRHEVEGAYAAQYRSNLGDRSGKPLIRLLLANSGSHSAFWRHTVDELAKRQETDDKLVAVAGLGPSTRENLLAARKLSDHGLALVASTMTTTEVGNIRRFVRITPTNAEEAQAAAEYLKGEKRFESAAVVEDVDEDDSYAKTLASAFREAFAGSGGGGPELAAEPLTFDSSVGDAWENELDFMTDDLCRRPPDVIFFAGRGIHLNRFLSALDSRACQETRFTVITGDDTTNLGAEQRATAAKKKIDVLFTALAHPEMFSEHPQLVSAASARLFADGGQFEKWFPNDARDDGGAMTAYDATLTAALGARMASADETGVTGAEVARMFRQMEARPVDGSSGFLSFLENGNPRERWIPILRLGPGGRTEFVESIRTHPSSS